MPLIVVLLIWAGLSDPRLPMVSMVLFKMLKIGQLLDKLVFLVVILMTPLILQTLGELLPRELGKGGFMSKIKTTYNEYGHPIRNTDHPGGGESMTIQSHAKGLTVNEIMKRFATTRTIPDRGTPGQFLDTTVSPNMFDALNMRVSLDKYFNGLDSGTRGRFDNDPLKLVNFVNDPKNLQASLDIGLLKLKPEAVVAKAKWDAEQLKKKADQRAAFVADVSQILKENTPQK